MNANPRKGTRLVLTLHKKNSIQIGEHIVLYLVKCKGDGSVQIGLKQISGDRIQIIRSDAKNKEPRP